MSTSLDKIQLIPVENTILPNKCGSCGHMSGPFFDFGLSVDWYGAVYLCVDCVRTAAKQIGYGPVEFDANELKLIKSDLAYWKDRCERILAAIGVAIDEPTQSVIVESVVDEEIKSEQSDLFRILEDISIRHSDREEGSPESTDESGLASLFSDDSGNIADSI